MAGRNWGKLLLDVKDDGHGDSARVYLTDDGSLNIYSSRSPDVNDDEGRYGTLVARDEAKKFAQLLADELLGHADKPCAQQKAAGHAVEFSATDVDGDSIEIDACSPSYGGFVVRVANSNGEGESVLLTEDQAESLYNELGRRYGPGGDSGSPTHHAVPSSPRAGLTSAMREEVRDLISDMAYDIADRMITERFQKVANGE